MIQNLARPLRQNALIPWNRNIFTILNMVWKGLIKLDSSEAIPGESLVWWFYRGTVDGVSPEVSSSLSDF